MLPRQFFRYSSPTLTPPANDSIRLCIVLPLSVADPLARPVALDPDRALHASVPLLSLEIAIFGHEPRLVSYVLLLELDRYLR